MYLVLVKNPRGDSARVGTFASREAASTAVFRWRRAFFAREIGNALREHHERIPTWSESSTWPKTWVGVSPDLLPEVCPAAVALPFAVCELGPGNEYVRLEGDLDPSEYRVDECLLTNDMFAYKPGAETATDRFGVREQIEAFWGGKACTSSSQKS
jgi:hypothetical protein